jgi:hypothetical protein
VPRMNSRPVLPKPNVSGENVKRVTLLIGYLEGSTNWILYDGSVLAQRSKQAK